jgi:hypothetical protein
MFHFFALTNSASTIQWDKPQLPAGGDGFTVVSAMHHTHPQ